MDYKVFKNDKRPMVRLDQMLTFINYYDLTISYKREDLIIKWQWFTFWHKDYLDLFEILMVLHMENVITLIFYDVGNDNWRINKDLVNLLKECVLNEWLSTKFIFSNKNNFDWKYDIFEVLSQWDIIKDKIQKYDWFDISVQIKGNPLLNLLFRKITEFIWYSDIDKEYTGRILYNNILEQTWWKFNHLNKIELFYKFEDDYMKEKRLILPLLIELENNWNLLISNIKIDWEYIYFELEKILDISEELFIRVSKDIKFEWEKQDILKIEYTKDWVKINSNKWIPNESLKSEIFLRVLSNYFYINSEYNEISISELNSYYLENRDELLYDIDKEKRIKYLTLSEKNINNSYIKTINKKVLEDYTKDFLQIGRWVIRRKKIVS